MLLGPNAWLWDVKQDTHPWKKVLLCHNEPLGSAPQARIRGSRGGSRLLGQPGSAPTLLPLG